MTREEAKELLPIMQAFAEGKTIEYRESGGAWKVARTPTWSSCLFYRIKPEPRYRPFKTQEECWNEMLKHQPFGWFRSTRNKKLFNIICIDDEGIKITNTLIKSEDTYDKAFNNLEFADGTPFGIEE